MKKILVSFVSLLLAAVSFNCFAGSYFYAKTCVQNETQNTINITSQYLVIASGPGSSYKYLPASIDAGQKACVRYRSFGNIKHNFTILNASGNHVLGKVQTTYKEGAENNNDVNTSNGKTGRISYEVTGHNQFTFYVKTTVQSGASN